MKKLLINGMALFLLGAPVAAFGHSALPQAQSDQSAGTMKKDSTMKKGAMSKKTGAPMTKKSTSPMTKKTAAPMTKTATTSHSGSMKSNSMKKSKMKKETMKQTGMGKDAKSPS